MDTEPQISSAKPVLSVSIGPDDIIYLLLGGNIYQENLEEFRSWAEQFKQAMVTTAKKKPGQVYTYIDITGLEHFDISTSQIVYDLMEFNKQYATRTAVVGAGSTSTAVIKAMTKLAGRDNFRPFPTKEAAMQWLQHGDTAA